MANVDRPNGFKPVKTLSGAPVSGLIRTVGCANSDIYVGDAIMLSSGLAAASTAHADEIIGVAVGFAKKGSFQKSVGAGGNYDNMNIESSWFDASDVTYTDWVCMYVPAEDVVFEAQFDGTPTSTLVGQGYGLIYTTGSATTGRSAQEIDGDDQTDMDVKIVEIPDIPGNDPTAAYGRVWVMFDDTVFHWADS